MQEYVYLCKSGGGERAKRWFLLKQQFFLEKWRGVFFKRHGDFSIKRHYRNCIFMHFEVQRKSCPQGVGCSSSTCSTLFRYKPKMVIREFWHELRELHDCIPLL